MVDMIYDFVRNTFIGADTTISGADNLATLITWTIIVMMFLLFIKATFWAFNLTFNAFKTARWVNRGRR